MDPSLSAHQNSEEDSRDDIDYDSEPEEDGPLLSETQMIESDTNHDADTPVYEEEEDHENEFVVQPLDGPTTSELYVGGRLDDDEEDIKDETRGFDFVFGLVWLTVFFLLLTAVHTSCYCVPPFLFLAAGFGYLIYALALAVHRMIKNRRNVTRYTVVALAYLLSAVFVVTVLLAAWAAERAPFYGALYASFAFLLLVALLQSWVRFANIFQRTEHWTVRDPVVTMEDMDMPPSPSTEAPGGPESAEREEAGLPPNNKRRAPAEDLF